MVKWLINLNLRVKLLLAFASILGLSILFMSKALQTEQTLSHYRQLNETIDEANINLLQMDIAIKAFIADGYKSSIFQKENKSEELERFAKELQDLNHNLNTLKIHDDTSLQKIESLVQHLKLQVYSLAGLLRERGFKDFGLEGDLRQAIHKVENSAYSFNKADMLMLRRHEKDFFIRKDLKYQSEFNNKHDSFVAEISNRATTESQQEVLSNLKRYKFQFNRIVDLEEKIGLQQGGIKGTINSDFELIKKEIWQLQTVLKEKSTIFQKTAWAMLTILLIVQLSVSLLLAILYANVITRPVRQLLEAMTQFASGYLPEKVPVRSNDEIGKTKGAFNQLIDRIEAAQNFSTRLGNGDLQARYPQKFQEDLLGQSLRKMQSELVKSAEEQRIINWTNQGTILINDVLRSGYQSIDELGHELVKLIIQYLGAQQGALFVVREENKRLLAKRVATYAYEKRKYINQQIEAGQGIIGQCLLEKSTIVLKSVPADFLKITSGLGEALPRFVVVTPLVIRGQILGILELAFFEEIENFKLSFLERVGENIASLLFSVSSEKEMRLLLAESQAKAEALLSQEEELRQSTEEMQAITEQLEREKRDLEIKIQSYQSFRKEELASQ